MSRTKITIIHDSFGGPFVAKGLGFSAHVEFDGQPNSLRHGRRVQDILGKLFASWDSTFGTWISHIAPRTSDSCEQGLNS